MMAILNSLNAHNFSILQPILKILVAKSMVHRALSGKTYLSLGLLSPLNFSCWWLRTKNSKINPFPASHNFCCLLLSFIYVLR